MSPRVSIINGTTILSTNNVEVINISRRGLILVVGDKEYYLSYGKYPWFKNATIDQVFDVKLLGRNRVRWDSLDVDLSLSILSNPEAYPLISN